MIANDILHLFSSPLSAATSALEALARMDEYGVTHLPVIEGGNYLGLVSEAELLSWGEQHTVASAPLFAPYVLPDSHLIEVIVAMNRYEVDVLPVVSSEGVYVGAIAYAAVIKGLGTMCQTLHAGATLLLTMSAADYSVGLLSRLAEENDTTIINLLSYASPRDVGRLQVCIKINREDATPYMRALERYGYQVENLLQPSERGDDAHLRSKIDELIHYIEM